MTRKNTSKKLISFAKYSLIDMLVKDEAELRNLSDSAVIEERLLDSLLPKDRNARSWIETFLTPENGGVGKVLQSAFSYNSAGVAWQSKHDNLLPLVEFLLRHLQCNCNYIPTGNEKEFQHCCSQLDSIVNRLDTLSSQETNIAKQFELSEECDFAKHLLNELKTDPQYCTFLNITQMVVESWKVLCGYSITYRLLADLVAMGNCWENSPEERLELIRILKEVSNQWINEQGNVKHIHLELQNNNKNAAERFLRLIEEYCKPED